MCVCEGTRAEFPRFMRNTRLCWTSSATYVIYWWFSFTHQQIWLLFRTRKTILGPLESPVKSLSSYSCLLHVPSLSMLKLKLNINTKPTVYSLLSFRKHFWIGLSKYDISMPFIFNFYISCCGQYCMSFRIFYKVWMWLTGPVMPGTLGRWRGRFGIESLQRSKNPTCWN